MNMIKLRLASIVLADERYLDSDDEYVLRLVKDRLIRPRHVYYALECFGYRWIEGRWILIISAWIKYCHDKNNALYRLRQSE